MVFAILASAVTPLAAYAFPTFASYKAIKANDPSQMIPWLMFWSVQACVAFIEHFCYVFLQWVPLYKELKMGLVLWMVLPQTQGANYLYLHYVHPNIARHERDLDNLIISLHEQIKSRGGQYVELLIVKISEILFGPTVEAVMRPGTKNSAETQSHEGGGGYIASLFSRFRTVPVGSAPETLPSSLLSFLNYTRSGGDIIPAHLNGEERSRYVQQQRARLQEALHMLEAAEQSYPIINVSGSPRGPPEVTRRNARGPSGMASRSVSGARTPVDSDYEDLGTDEHLRKQSHPTTPESGSGGWFWKNK